jgi:DNA-binding FadR family transcriptional regulator
MIENKKKPDQLVELDYKIHSLLMELAENNVLRLLFNRKVTAKGSCVSTGMLEESILNYMQIN